MTNVRARQLVHRNGDTHGVHWLDRSPQLVPDNTVLSDNQPLVIIDGVLILPHRLFFFVGERVEQGLDEASCFGDRIRKRCPRFAEVGRWPVLGYVGRLLRSDRRDTGYLLRSGAEFQPRGVLGVLRADRYLFRPDRCLLLALVPLPTQHLLVGDTLCRSGLALASRP